MTPDLFEFLRLQKAGELLDLINYDLKKNDKYQSIAYYEENGFTVFIIANKNKDILMNILDYEGNIPSGFCANWRSFSHIKQELKLTKNG